MQKQAVKNIVLRNMRVGDLEEVIAIEKASFPTPWSENMFLEEIHSSLCRDLVAELDGRLAGYISFIVIPYETQLRNIAVREDVRRCKVASRLMEEMFRISSERGAKLCILEVRKSNHSALRMYKKLGFVISGIRSNYYTDTHEDALVMKATLRPAQGDNYVCHGEHGCHDEPGYHG